MGKDKKKYRRLKLDLFMAKSKLFCILYAPTIMTVLEVLLNSYREYRSKIKKP